MVELYRAIKRRKIVILEGKDDEDDHDYLSVLSDCLLHHIFSFMHAKDVVRTCLLSKRWRSTWTTGAGLDNVVIYDYDWKKGYENFNWKQRFEPSFVDGLLEHYSPEKIINRFHLRFSHKYDNLDRGQIGSWLEFAVNHGVKDLSMNLRCHCLRLSQLVCNCSSVVNLELRCSVLEISSSSSNSIRWTSLKSLTIHESKLSDELIREIFRGSPSLEFLKLENCYGINHVHVEVNSLRELVISGYKYPSQQAFLDWFYRFGDPDVSTLIIDAPNLKILRILGEWYGKTLRLTEASSVLQVEINLTMTGGIGGGYSSMVDTMKGLSCTSKFYTSTRLLSVLARPKWGEGDAELPQALEENLFPMLPVLGWKDVTVRAEFDTSEICFGFVRLLKYLHHVERLVILIDEPKRSSRKDAKDEPWGGESFMCKSLETVEIIILHCRCGGRTGPRLRWLHALMRRLCPNVYVFES